MEELAKAMADVRRELTTIRQLMTDVVFYIREAESECPEKMRRFTNYMHDIHDISYMYEEKGHQPPEWLKREFERCDDRYRQLLKELNMEGGNFAKVRAAMAGDKDNRFDHARLITAQGLHQKENGSETGQS
jgi:hypothetical protein